MGENIFFTQQPDNGLLFKHSQWSTTNNPRVQPNLGTENGQISLRINGWSIGL